MAKTASITITYEDGSHVTYGAPFFAWAVSGDVSKGFCDCSLAGLLIGTATLLADFAQAAAPTLRKRKKFARKNLVCLYTLMCAILKLNHEEVPNE